jgi:predicted acylesterase/phospholipase RssA
MTDAPAQASPTQASPTQECDLIMKGGVTSGLVYPGAIYALSEQFRLRNIGGTSAGAIGAVAAAAMEFGRRSSNNPDARSQMGDLPSELAAKTDQGESRLEAMFCGDPGRIAGEPGTAPLLAGLKGVLAGRPGALRRLLGGAKRPLASTAAATAVQALAGGVLAGFVAAQAGMGAIITASAAALATLATIYGTGKPNVVASVQHGAPISLGSLNRALRPFVSNGLGLATGFADPPGATIKGDQLPSLTLWLHQTIQRLAGLSATEPDDVLTFGKLWSLGTDPNPSAFDVRAIDLVLVCSDLNRMQSASFPFLPDNHRLYYDPVEWQRLFPEPVLKALEKHSWPVLSDAMPAALGYDLDNIRQAAKGLGAVGERLRLLPKGKHIPIIVGARASMAFPGLFTPLPLWVLRWIGEPKVVGLEPVLSPVYLSDGGITSNFPIHLFDSVLPTRPTFAVNLLYPGDDLSIEEFTADDGNAARGKSVPGNVRTLGSSFAVDEQYSTEMLIMPFADQDRVNFYKAPASGAPVQQVAGLIARVVETARTWGDVSLYNQVGVRDRIIHIRLTGQEGGFNLSMDKASINSLNVKGTAAGTTLNCRFRFENPVDTLDTRGRFTLTWNNHRRIRAESVLIAQDLLSTRFMYHWQRRGSRNEAEPPFRYLIGDTRYRHLAEQLAAAGAVRVPADEDPLKSALRPMNILRMRPSDTDPRGAARTPGRDAWEKG